jgi:intracellular sulfur oxidation DsrE/DsrF family protein
MSGPGRSNRERAGLSSARFNTGKSAERAFWISDCACLSDAWEILSHFYKLNPRDLTMESNSRLVRRSFLSVLGLTAAAAGTVGTILPAGAQSSNRRFEPSRHAKDDWLDQVPGQHRFVFDTTTPQAAGGALLYANNFFTANKSGYNLDPVDLAVVIVMRHFSTPFAYNDAMWAKYGAHFSELVEFTDPKTKQAPATNLYNAAGYGFSLPNFGTTLDSLVQRRVQFAVCDMATHFFAGALADKTKTVADNVYDELAANLIPNSHLVPAGIVAVNRAQERGYAFSYVV